MQGVFVTGTGTGVGKSIVAAALCAALVQQGRDVLASKPLLSGLDDAPDGPWPHDHELLALVTGEAPDEIAPNRFGPAVSPHLAARLAGQSLDTGDVAAAVVRRYEARRRPNTETLVVVEGAGGLLVPIEDDATSMASLAFELGLPLVIVAHPGLGTINHVLLTLEAARARNLAIAGVVLTPWPADPSAIELDNRRFLDRHAGVTVRALGPVDTVDAAHLAAAGLAAGLHKLI